MVLVRNVLVGSKRHSEPTIIEGSTGSLGPVSSERSEHEESRSERVPGPEKEPKLVPDIKDEGLMSCPHMMS